MFKSAGVISSLTGEVASGQFEIAIAEAAILGAVIGFKKIISKVHDKRERKSDQKEAQAAE